MDRKSYWGLCAVAVTSAALFISPFDQVRRCNQERNLSKGYGSPMATECSSNLKETICVAMRSRD